MENGLDFVQIPVTAICEVFGADSGLSNEEKGKIISAFQELCMTGDRVSVQELGGKLYGYYLYLAGEYERSVQAKLKKQKHNEVAKSSYHRTKSKNGVKTTKKYDADSDVTTYEVEDDAEW